MGTSVNNIAVLKGSNSRTERSHRPVFVMGCHRSGTNLLYDTLLSAGGFALYHGYLPFYKIFIPRFGHPRNMANRRKIVDAFVRSKGFERSGLNASDLSVKLLAEGKTAGDFIRIVMDEVAHQQGACRWAVYDPDNLLHIPRIKADMPDALFIHIVRDGRDIALSLKKMGGFRPFPWRRRPRNLFETALYWQWTVQTGRRHGSQLPNDYLEIHYEDLVTAPRETLNKLSEFLDHDLDYDRIRDAALGRVRQSNSSFLDEGGESSAHPVNRWKERLSAQEIRDLETLIGPCLQENGYPLTSTAEQRSQNLRWKFLAAAYPFFLSTKLWLKLHTPVGRFSNLSALGLSDRSDEAS